MLVKAQQWNSHQKHRQVPPVRSVFKGEVTSVSRWRVYIMVHTVPHLCYLNLGSVSVGKGQQVGTGQASGRRFRRYFQFQLRKETQKLNPEQWLRYVAP